MRMAMGSIAFGARTVWAILLTLLVGSILILLAGASPLAAYRALFEGAFLDYWGIANTLVRASPMLLAALAVIVPLRAGLYNIGGEGQIYMGGLFATIVALWLPPLPTPVGVILTIMAACLGGAAWAAIAGFLRAYRGINEVIVTLLLNFVAIHLVNYAVSGPMMADGAPYPYSDELGVALRLPIMMPRTDVHAGVLFGPLLALLCWFYFSRTTQGFALDVIGRNPQAARYAGLAVERHIFFSMMVGGAVAGLAGGCEVIGLKYRLFHMFGGGYGFDGIVVAFMASGNPVLAPLAAVFLSSLKAGAGIMERAVGVERTVVEAIQGIAVIFVAIAVSWKARASRGNTSEPDRKLPSSLISKSEMQP